MKAEVSEKLDKVYSSDLGKITLSRYTKLTLFGVKVYAMIKNNIFKQELC